MVLTQTLHLGVKKRKEVKEMPYHLDTARTEPARTILFAVAIMTVLAQAVAVWLSWPVGIINGLLTLPICFWGVWATKTNNMKHMGWSSFWISAIWIWTGLLRLLIVDGVGELLWVPFLIVGVVMGICYLYFSYHRKHVLPERIGEVG